MHGSRSQFHQMMLLYQQKKFIQNNGTYSYISLFWCEISFTVSRGWRLERTTCWKRLLLATKKKQQTETMTEHERKNKTKQNKTKQKQKKKLS